MQLHLYCQDLEWIYLPTPILSLTLLSSDSNVWGSTWLESTSWKQNYQTGNILSSLAILLQMSIHLELCQSTVFKILLALFILIQLHRIEKKIQCRAVSWVGVWIHIQKCMLLVEVNACSSILPHSRVSNNITVIILPLSSTYLTSQKWVNLITIDCDIICKILIKYPCLKLSYFVEYES